MQDTDLFLSLAEIAGVFVAFGTLIAIRSGSTIDVSEVTGIGMVVWCAILVVILALTPVVVSRFDVTGHELWLACSLAALALWWIGDELVRRASPERRAYQVARPLRIRWRVEIGAAFLWMPMNIALILIVLGLLPEQEAALYLAAVVLLLFMDALLLLMMVISGGGRATGSHLTAPPSNGAADGHRGPGPGGPRPL